MYKFIYFNNFPVNLLNERYLPTEEEWYNRTVSCIMQYLYSIIQTKENILENYVCMTLLKELRKQASKTVQELNISPHGDLSVNPFTRGTYFCMPVTWTP